MALSTATEEGRVRRHEEFVSEAKKGRRWQALTRLIGGVPRQDLQDYIPGQDDGEPPHGAQWD